MKNSLKLIITIAISELAGIVGSIFTTPSIPLWYTTLIKPDLAPPNWVFAPVWSTLFALMGIALFLVWKKGLERRDVKIAISVFVVQLILNTTWSYIFFGLQSPGLAFLEIIILWLAILTTIIFFAKISKSSAWLLVPYIIWVSFAAYLNFSIWQLNQPKEQNSKPNDSEELWQTTTATSTDATFSFPTSILTKYIHTVDWPPQMRIINEPFTCAEAGLETDRTGITEKRTVDNRTYCVTRENEGAAGSTYTMYAYAFPSGFVSSAPKDKQTFILTFTLRSVQCANYNEPEKTACENERSSFDIDALVDKIVKSIKFNTIQPY